MTDQVDDATRNSLEAAVRSFTDAEIALREIVAAAQRFRTASESLDQAQATLEATNGAAMETVATLRGLAARLDDVSGSLASAALTLTAVDPPRLWTSIGAIEKATGEQAARIPRRSPLPLGRPERP